VKSKKLSKETVPRTIAAVAATLWGLKLLEAPRDLKLQLVRKKLLRPSKNDAFPSLALWQRYL
jgi:hypothetical protein